MATASGFEAARAIGATTPERALDDNDAPIYHWYPNARLNLCHNVLDRQTDAGRGDDDGSH